MMHPGRFVKMGAGLLLSAALLAPPVMARSTASGDDHAAAAGNKAMPCFFRRNWNGVWKVTPNARTIYIRVSGSIYELELDTSYPLLKDPFAELVNRGTGDTICSPLDFRLTVSNQAGVEQWPIVKKLIRLTPAQAAKLPKKLRP